MPYSNFRILRAAPIVLFFTFLTLLSCGQGVGDPELLNGYWEIREVEFPDGQQKEYIANSTIDFFQVEGMAGFRKKVQPQVDGTFRTSDDAAPLRIIQKEGLLALIFDEEEEVWQEEILSLTEKKLVTRHENGMLYTYERHNPLPLAHGKK